jgi:molybdopterin synthase sulfur carrier subunit
MDAPMIIELHLFARMRELCGNRAKISLEVAEGATAEDCFELLCEEFSSVRPYRATLAVAVNEEYAAWDCELHRGDAVAFIPPVSGG